MSRVDYSVKTWPNLPISGPKANIHNINAHTKFGEIHWHLLKLSFRNKNMDISQADNTVKNRQICRLAIPNQISTISVYIPSFEIYSSSRNENIDGQTDDRRMDRQTHTQMTNLIPEYPIIIKRWGIKMFQK